MSNYILSPQAQKRLIQIRNYTFKNYGEKQTKIYLEMLRDRMQMLAENLIKGTVRDDIKAGYYSVLAGKHTIYYRMQPEHIEIIDILNQKMEPTKNL